MSYKIGARLAIDFGGTIHIATVLKRLQIPARGIHFELEWHDGSRYMYPERTIAELFKATIICTQISE